MTKAEVPDKPSLPIYLSGPMPHGAVWCATCVMIYLGTVSAEEELQKYVRELHVQAVESGASLVSIDMAERDDLQLQPAVTVAPSTYFEVPMPVCWTHCKGYRFATAAEKAAGKTGMQQEKQIIIPGKAYGSDQYRT
jgi:hypothetical protein